MSSSNNGQNFDDLERKAQIEAEIIDAEDELATLEAELSEIDEQLGLASEADEMKKRSAHQKKDEARHIRKLIQLRKEELARLKSRPTR